MKYITPWKVAISITLLLMFFVIYETSFAADLQVSGAGTSAANGCYVDSGIGGYVAGTEWWKQDGSYAIYTAGIVGVDTYCRLGTQADPGGTQLYYADIGGSNVACSSSIAAGLTYSVDSGTGPAPTITETTCPSASVPDMGGANVNAATSTIEQAQTNLAFGFMFFFVSFFLIVWLLRKH